MLTNIDIYISVTRHVMVKRKVYFLKEWRGAYTLFSFNKGPFQDKRT